MRQVTCSSRLSYWWIDLIPGFDYCVRFLYNIALDDKISVHPAIFDVYQRRKEIVPFQNRMVANSSAFIRDGHWHEAKFNVHGWEQADLVSNCRLVTNCINLADAEIFWSINDLVKQWWLKYGRYIG